MSRFVEGVARWLRLRPPGRDVVVRPDDTFLTSYPRSGNTWARFILANLLDPEASDYTAIRRSVPDIYKESVRDIDGRSSPRILKSHEPFDPRYPRVVYLVRDPRAVAVSYFHQQKRFGLIPADTPIDRFVALFIDGRADGFGSWSDHVESWINTHGRRGDRFFLVRYEDLHRDGVKQVAGLARFLGLDKSDAVVERAFERSSLERMRELERAEMRGEELPKHTTYVRRGGSSWRDELPDELATKIAAAFGDTMTKLGYDG